MLLEFLVQKIPLKKNIKLKEEYIDNDKGNHNIIT